MEDEYNPFKDLGNRLQRVENLLTQLVRSGEQQPTQEEAEQILTVEQTAQLLHLSKKTIYERVRARTLPFYRDGKRILFKRSELLAYLDTQKVSTLTELNRMAQGALNGTE